MLYGIFNFYALVYNLGEKDGGTYAQVSVEMSYDYGMGCGDIEQEGLTRHEEQVVVTKVVYK